MNRYKKEDHIRKRLIDKRILPGYMVAIKIGSSDYEDKFVILGDSGGYGYDIRNVDRGLFVNIMLDNDGCNGGVIKHRLLGKRYNYLGDVISFIIGEYGLFKSIFYITNLLFVYKRKRDPVSYQSNKCIDYIYRIIK